MKDGKRPAQDDKSSWKNWKLREAQLKKPKKGSYALRKNLEKAGPNVASQEQLPEKKIEAPPPLILYTLEDPGRAAWYKLELTCKAGFPLHKLRLPLVSPENDVGKDHNFSIHGLQEVSVEKIISKKIIPDKYRIVEQKCRHVQYTNPSAPQPLKLIHYRELMSQYWSCLSKKFKTDDAYYDYQNAKHNLNRYPREMFLLNTMILGGGYINKIEGIMKLHKYVAGPTRYNCLAFVEHLKAGLGVEIEVGFHELPHRLNCPLGIVKILNGSLRTS